MSSLSSQSQSDLSSRLSHDTRLCMTTMEVSSVNAKAPQAIQDAMTLFSQYVCGLSAIPGTSGGPESVCFTATGFFLDTGLHRYLVTARHVVDELDRLAQVHGDASLVALGHGTSMEVTRWRRRRVRGDADIAGLIVPPAFHPREIGLAYWRQYPWTRPRPRNDEQVYVSGTPRSLQFAMGGLLRTGRVDICEGVASVSERHFVLAPQNGPRTLYRHGQDSVGPLLDIGGLSGAPAWALRRPAPEIVGVVYEGGPALEGCLYIAHHDFLPP